MTGTLARLPIDPDLEQAMNALLPHVDRLALIDSEIVAISRASGEYARLGPLYERRGVVIDNIKGWAKRVGVKPAAMRVFAEEFARLRRRNGRKPSLAHLQQAVIVKRDILRGERTEREAAKALADWAAIHAIDRSNGADEAVDYLEKCSG